MFTLSLSAQNVRYMRELESGLKPEDNSKLWETYSELARQYSALDSAQAWEYYTKAFQNTAGLEGRKEFMHLITKGILLEDAKQTDSAKFYYSTAISLAESLGIDSLISRGYNNLGRLKMLEGYTTESIEDFKIGISIGQNNQDSKTQVGLYANLGYAYHTLTNYDSALVFYLKGAKICETYPDYPCAKLYNNMGITYQSQGDLDKAENYNYKALNIRGEALDSLGVAASYSNIAGTHWFRGQIDSATYYTKKAYVIHEAGNDIRGMSLCLANLGAVYNYQGKYEESIEATGKSIALHKRSLDKEKLAIAYFNMAEPQLALKRYSSTFAYLDTALNMGEELGSKLILRESYNLKSQAYRELGRVEEAWENKELYHSYKDSILLEANDKQVAELEAKFETEAKERKINEQDLLLAQKDLVIERNGWLIGSISLLVIFILVMAFLLRNRIKLKAKERLAEERKKSIEQQIDAVVKSVDDERRRFSEDLHDGFGQYISLIKHKVDQLNGTNSIEDKEKVYYESEKILKEMGGELKNICFNLMPATLIKYGLDAGLNEYLFRINSSGKIATEYISHGLENERMAEVLEINIYRIFQEWTNNIMKHSNAKKITVQLIQHADEINLSIEDDGEGFNLDSFKNSKKGNGWKNILSRKNLIKAELQIDSQKGLPGTTFILDAPIKLRENKEIAENAHA